jgi:hypothetical protein
MPELVCHIQLNLIYSKANNLSNNDLASNYWFTILNLNQTGLITKRLDGKIAVITGGNSGIGLVTARRFVEEGAIIFIANGFCGLFGAWLVIIRIRKCHIN